MTDRDHFAAAALTGLLAQGDDGSFSEESYARAAFRWADVMLRERLRNGAVRGCETVQPATNHDVAPAAKAVSDEDRTDKAAASHRDDGTGDTPVTEPMPKGNRAEVSSTTHDAVPAAIDQLPAGDHASVGGGSDRNDKPAPRPAVVTGDTQEPVAWAVIPGTVLAGRAWRVTLDREEAEQLSCGAMLVVPLYEQPQPKLTDAEREAIADAIRRLWGFDCAATLRGLLERTV